MAQNDPAGVSQGSRKSNRPSWSAGKLALCIIFVVLAVGLVYQGVQYISEGVGALVPYLMILVGPSIAVYYIWFLLFRSPDQDTE
jgi:hypothetical protein